MIARGLLIAGCLVLAGRGTSTEAAEHWVHVKVDDARKEERVRVNVPLELVVEILPLVSADRLERGRVRIEFDGAGDTDFRAIWAAVRKAKDGEYATVQDRHSNVRVRKSGGFQLVEAREAGEGTPGRVNVRLPLAVVDALLGANEEELDVLAAVKALGDHAHGVVVDVEDGEERVRVWIDEQSGQQD